MKFRAEAVGVANGRWIGMGLGGVDNGIDAIAEGAPVKICPHLSPGDQGPQTKDSDAPGGLGGICRCRMQQREDGAVAYEVPAELTTVPGEVPNGPRGVRTCLLVVIRPECSHKRFHGGPKVRLRWNE